MGGAKYCIDCFAFCECSIVGVCADDKPCEHFHDIEDNSREQPGNTNDKQ